MGTLADTKIVRGRGNSKMPEADRRRANAFWQARIMRAERKDRLYR